MPVSTPEAKSFPEKNAPVIISFAVRPAALGSPLHERWPQETQIQCSVLQNVRVRILRRRVERQVVVVKINQSATVLSRRRLTPSPKKEERRDQKGQRHHQQGGRQVFARRIDSQQSC